LLPPSTALSHEQSGLSRVLLTHLPRSREGDLSIALKRRFFSLCLTISVTCCDGKRFTNDDFAEISFFRGFYDRKLWTVIKKTRASFFQRSPPNQNVVRGMLYQGQEINSQVRSLEVLYVTPSTLTKAPSALIQTSRLWLKHRTFTQEPDTVTQARKTDTTTEYCNVTVTETPNAHSSTEHFESSTVTATYALSTVTEAVILSTCGREVPSLNHAGTLNTARFLYLSSVLPGKSCDSNKGCTGDSLLTIILPFNNWLCCSINH